MITIISSTIIAEVGDGVETSGLFFHGTNRACTLGDRRTNDELCNNNKCNLCGIIRTSFDLSRSGMWLPGFTLTLDLSADTTPAGTKHKFSRFGHGIYTSACSSSRIFFPFSVATQQLTRRAEADDYFKDVANCKVQSRALLVNAVVYGRPQELTKTDKTANPCGSGYHSVSAEELYGYIRVDRLFCAGDGGRWRRSQLRGDRRVQQRSYSACLPDYLWHTSRKGGEVKKA